MFVGHARLARLRSCIRRSRQVTPQPAKDNVFKPNLLEVARKLVPVVSPCRRHRVMPGAGTRRPRGTLDAGHGPGWGKTGFKAIGTTTRERTFGSCHLWFWQFFWVISVIAMFPSTAPDTSLQDVRPCVRAPLRPRPRPTGRWKQSG